SFRKAKRLAAERPSDSTAIGLAHSLRRFGKRRDMPRPYGRSMPSAFTSQARSADRRRVQDAALAPELVEAASQPHRRLQTDIGLEALAVIADQLDDVVGPVGG